MKKKLNFIFQFVITVIIAVILLVLITKAIKILGFIVICITCFVMTWIIRKVRGKHDD